MVHYTALRKEIQIISFNLKRRKYNSYQMKTKPQLNKDEYETSVRGNLYSKSRANDLFNGIWYMQKMSNYLLTNKRLNCSNFSFVLPFYSKNA